MPARAYRSRRSWRSPHASTSRVSISDPGEGPDPPTWKLALVKRRGLSARCPTTSWTSITPTVGRFFHGWLHAGIDEGDDREGRPQDADGG